MGSGGVAIFAVISVIAKKLMANKKSIENDRKKRQQILASNEQFQASLLASYQL